MGRHRGQQPVLSLPLPSLPRCWGSLWVLQKVLGPSSQRLPSSQPEVQPPSGHGARS